ncbi:hypothetical protein HPP92_017676 [Vanilla planifolia]|uniref:Uncharacterized protein n=1 Tax=Vanilla planifolia TaxID=51239 RepID=A0A835Q8G3_VANPL|nr:hypothetical protein HPP92_017676 [Vanilla planifolia]
MALVVICGQPCSGKSTAALCLASALEATEPKPKVRIIDEFSLNLSRNRSYAGLIYDLGYDESRYPFIGSSEDKKEIVEGYRYELWCLARAAGIRYCVFHASAFCDAEKTIVRMEQQSLGKEEYSYEMKILIHFESHADRTCENETVSDEQGLCKVPCQRMER